MWNIWTGIIKIPSRNTYLSFSNDETLLVIALWHSIRLWNSKNDRRVLTIQIDEAATIMALSGYAHTLLTNSDAFKLGLTQTSAMAEHRCMTSSTSDLKRPADRQWVLIGEEEVLWLAPDHRPETARVWASFRSLVAIACGSNVLFVTGDAPADEECSLWTQVAVTSHDTVQQRIKHTSRRLRLQAFVPRFGEMMVLQTRERATLVSAKTDSE